MFFLLEDTDGRLLGGQRGSSTPPPPFSGAAPQAADAWPRPWGRGQPTTGHTPKVTAEITPPPQRAHRGHTPPTTNTGRLQSPFSPVNDDPGPREEVACGCRAHSPGRRPSNNTDRLTSARRHTPKTPHRYWHRGTHTHSGYWLSEGYHQGAATTFTNQPTTN